MFFGIALVIGSIFILGWFFLRRQAKASLAWPSVPGKVVESQLVQTRDSDGELATVASVRYTYAVGSTPLQGTRVSIATGNARAIVQKYPVGTDVQVHYDPGQPASAVLEAGGRGLTVLLVVGIAVILGGILLGLVQKGPSTGRQYDAAVQLYNQGKFTEAASAFADAAQSGSADAKVYLGEMFAKGKGVPQDFVEAQKWFILAGDPGKKNRDTVQAGLTPAQEQEAEAKAAAWKPRS